MSLSDDELSRLQALADAASPGPWDVKYHHIWFLVIGDHPIDFDAAGNDADFAAEAREAVPALIQEVRRLREANNKLCGQMNDAQGAILASVMDERDQLRAEVERLRKQLADGLAWSTSMDEWNDKLQAENAALKAEILRSHKETRDAMARADRANERADRGIQASDLITENAALKAEVDELTQSTGDKLIAIGRLNATIETLRADLARARASLTGIATCSPSSFTREDLIAEAAACLSAKPGAEGDGG